MNFTLKQQRFIDEYIITGNATKAAANAGYSEKTARSQGQRMLTNVDIKKSIDKRLKEIQNDHIATADEVLQYLTETMKLENLNRKERTKAAELLGKRYKLFSDSGDLGGKNDKIELQVTIKDCKDDS